MIVGVNMNEVIEVILNGNIYSYIWGHDQGFVLQIETEII